MVVVKLQGGLGNQMFQYATGRRLASVLKTSLKLDTTGFARDPLRTYSLACFHIQAGMALQQDLEKFSTPGPFSRFLSTWHSRFTYTIIKETPMPSFVPQVLSIKGNVYLKGYWQSERYFQDIRPILLQEFQLHEEPDAENRGLLQEIQHTNSIAIHVRRTDYVANSATNRLHGTCSLEYYANAIEVMIQRVREPYFFVFSDDADWAQKHLQIDYPTVYVTHNPSDKAHEDLRLMRQCRHFIIANSSFSWWGAWLAENLDKIVIVPQQWFQELPSGANADHIIPETWRRL